MQDGLVAIAAAVGLRFLLFEHSVLERVRAVVCRVRIFQKLCECSFCQGFHCGFVVGLVSGYGVWRALLCGLAAAAASYYIATWEERR